MPPEAFRPVQVCPLRPFFDIRQEALRALALSGTANPSVAVLRPGTARPLWFERMYLARELSCALLEGGDLTVGGDAVFPKSLRGLQRIDVLLRRMDGRMIDPLELEAGPLIGTPGLMGAACAGSVRIAYDPGPGAAEAPALRALLPAVALRLLGETLALASVPTLWLGEARARTLVAAEPQAWQQRPATDGAAPAQALAGGLPTPGLAKDVWVLAEDCGDIVGPAVAFATRFTDSVRDRLTGGMYAAFTQALRPARVEAASARRSLDELAHALVAVLRFSTTFAYVAAENMVPGGAWIFLELGHRLERAHAVAAEIGFALDLPPPRMEAGLRLVLELCVSAITYRARYFHVVQPSPVLALVLAYQGHPRSFAFQCAAMHALLDELTGESGAREAMAGTIAGLLA